MPAVEPLPLDQVGEVSDELEALAKANGYTANSFLIWMIANICSRVYGCEYCAGHTMKNGTRHGLPLEKAEALWEFRTSSLR